MRDEADEMDERVGTPRMPVNAKRDTGSQIFIVATSK